MAANRVPETAAAASVASSPSPPNSVPTEPPKEIRVTYVVAAEPPFDLKDKQETVLHPSECLQSIPGMDGWDVEFRLEDRRVLFDYSYGPCSLTHLGAGRLEEFVNVPGGLDSEDFPENEEARDGHVYLLNQGHWHHWVLLRVSLQSCK